MDSAVARMVCENFLAQSLPVDMHIDFGGNDTFVAEHLLNGAQVCPALEQMGGKGVAQCVRAYGLVYTGEFAKAFHNIENHHSRELAAAAIKK